MNLRDTLTDDELAIADAQGWNDDSLLTLITSVPEGGDRLAHLRDAADHENADAEPVPPLDRRLPESVTFPVTVQLANGPVRDLIAAAAKCASSRVGYAAEQYNVAQAVAELFMDATWPGESGDLIEAWHPADEWDQLAADEDDKPIPTFHYTTINTGKQPGRLPDVYGWGCVCGAEESPRYCAERFADEAAARHSETSTPGVFG